MTTAEAWLFILTGWGLIGIAFWGPLWARRRRHRAAAQARTRHPTWRRIP